MGAPKVPEALQASIRERFAGPFIAAGVLTLESAQRAIDEKCADLVDFGRPFLANPDLVARLQNGWPLNAPDFSTFYTPGPTGYIDYPAHAA
jgi:N-ethylmaleimide reductase